MVLLTTMLLIIINTKGNGIKGKLEITNRTVITNWKIVKVRKDDNKTIISGAKFALKQN